MSLKEVFLYSYFKGPNILLFLFPLLWLGFVVFEALDKKSYPIVFSSPESRVWFDQHREMYTAATVLFLGLCTILSMLTPARRVSGLPALMREDYRTESGIVTDIGMFGEISINGGKKHEKNEHVDVNIGDEVEIVYLPVSGNAVVTKLNGKEITYYRREKKKKDE